MSDDFLDTMIHLNLSSSGTMLEVPLHGAFCKCGIPFGICYAPFSVEALALSCKLLIADAHHVI